MDMGEIARVVEKAVKSEIKTQLGLVHADIREAKEERKGLKQKFFDLAKRVKRLESEKEEGTDYGV